MGYWWLHHAAPKENDKTTTTLARCRAVQLFSLAPTKSWRCPGDSAVPGWRLWTPHAQILRILRILPKSDEVLPSVQDLTMCLWCLWCLWCHQCVCVCHFLASSKVVMWSCVIPPGICSVSGTSTELLRSIVTLHALLKVRFQRN